MLNPPLNQLTSQIKSKYVIATTAAKRAREIDEQPETELLSEQHSFKPVGRALEEIADGKIRPVISSDYYGKEQFRPLKICEARRTSNTSRHIQIKRTYVGVFFQFIQ